MAEPEVVLRRRRDSGLNRPEAGRHRLVLALAGVIGIVGVTLPVVPAAAHSYHSRQHTRTITRLIALPSRGKAPGVVTLVATETSADGTHPAGRMQFEANGTDIGSPVGLDADGVATTSAAFSAAASAALSAAFTPTSTAYVASASTDAATVSGGSQAGSISVSLTVPVAGNFGVAVTPGTVALSVPAQGTRFATGMLQPITVTADQNYLPGWSVTGQASNLTAAGKPISGTQLGWIPAGTVTGGAKLGAPVAPGNPGLGSAGAVLATAAPGTGLGTDTLTAELMLAIPSGGPQTGYAGTLTITYMPAGQGPSSAGLELPSVH